MAVSHEHRLDAPLALLIEGRNRDPFAVLGPHTDADGVVVRAFQPSARSIDVVLSGELVPMTRIDSSGLYEARMKSDVDYRLRITFSADHVVEIDDPYRYGRVLSDFDLHLLGEGTQMRAFDKLGAHRVRVGSTIGIHFAVWAPIADRVRVSGVLKGGVGRIHRLQLL